MRKDDLRIIIASAIGIWIILTLMSLSSAAHAKVNCNRHPIYCQIKKNSPKLSSSKAMKLSNIIYKAVRKHRLPTRIFVAILAQESSYKLEAKGCHYGLRQETLAELKHRCKNTRFVQGSPQMSKYGYGICLSEGKINPEMVRSKVCSDFGIGQIYYKTAKGFGFNLSKLTTDLNYSIEAAAKVLADFKKRYSAKEVYWWTRYNSSSRIKRRIYKELVERYF